MRSASTPRFRRRQPVAWHALNRLILLLICVGLAAVVCLAMIPEWKRLETLRAGLAAKTAERDQEQALQIKQQREVQLLQNDPEYLELIARDKLDLMKEGETIFRLQEAKAEPVPVPATATVVAAPTPKPKK